jgi:hypothetical protein
VVGLFHKLLLTYARSLLTPLVFFSVSFVFMLACWWTTEKKKRPGASTNRRCDMQCRVYSAIYSIHSRIHTTVYVVVYIVYIVYIALYVCNIYCYALVELNTKYIVVRGHIHSSMRTHI